MTCFFFHYVAETTGLVLSRCCCCLVLVVGDVLAGLGVVDAGGVQELVLLSPQDLRKLRRRKTRLVM